MRVLDPVRGPEFQREPSTHQGSMCSAEALPEADSAPTWLARFSIGSGNIGRVEHFCPSADGTASAHGRALRRRYGLGHGIHAGQPRRPVDRVVPRRVLQDPARARHDGVRHQRDPASAGIGGDRARRDARPATRRSTSCSGAAAPSRSTARPCRSRAVTTSASIPSATRLVGRGRRRHHVRRRRAPSRSRSTTAARSL